MLPSSSDFINYMLPGLSNHLLDKQNFAAAAATHNGHASVEREREVAALIFLQLILSLQIYSPPNNCEVTF